MFVKGYKQSEEHKKRISNALRGKKLSTRHVQNLRASHLGIKRSPESLRKFHNTMLGHPVSEETREKIGDAHRGKKLPSITGNKHPRWKGGITPINKKIRHSVEYKLWRTAVFERDHYTCVWCGNKKSGNLNADHIKPFAYFPELRFAIDNGRTLCVPCHRKTYISFHGNQYKTKNI